MVAKEPFVSFMVAKVLPRYRQTTIIMLYLYCLIEQNYFMYFYIVKIKY